MTNVYRNTLQYPEAAKVPGVLLVTVDSAIYFSNCNYVRERYVPIYRSFKLLGPSLSISILSSTLFSCDRQIHTLLDPLIQIDQDDNRFYLEFLIIQKIIGTSWNI